MKKMIAVLVGCSMLLATTTVFGAEQLPERLLDYGRITQIHEEQGEAVSIWAEGVDGQTTIYTLSDETAFLDSGNGVKMDVSQLKEGDGVYFYHKPIMTMSIPPQTPTEAVVGNLPMDVACAHLHTAENVGISQEGARITTEDGSLILSVEQDAFVTNYADGKETDLSKLDAGERFFTWYEAVAESYPAQASVNRVVILEEGAAEEPDTQETGAKVVFQEEIVTKNDVSYIPLRQAADGLGLSLTWNGEERTAVLRSEMRAMRLTEGQDLYTSTAAQEGMIGMTAPLELGAAPFIDSDGKMYVPAEAFRAFVGYTVTEQDGTVTIAETA